MGLETRQILVYLRGGLSFSVRTFWRSLSNHPFIWIAAFSALCLYRLLPSVFAFFVTSAPVIVCTAVLLGTLLSFGQPNIPEIEEEEKESQNISALRSSGPANNLVVDRGASFSVETHVNKRTEEEEKAIKVENEVPEKDMLLQDKLTESRLEDGDKQVEGRIEGTKEKSSTLLADQIDSSYILSRKETDDASNDLDSDSDHAESSSPDASMTDITPMLDELHPLLDVEAPQAANKSLEDFDGASGGSHESDNASEELAEDRENHEEEVQEDQDDGSAKVVTWTEDDEKNLKDIKNLELERDRKMEHLIAKRIATKNLKAMTERNLIDLDSIPIQISPVSIVRRNPFDFPFESDEAMGLPPIPGSAPSVLLPRVNPFDLPYDQLNERGRVDLGGKSSQADFPAVSQRDAFFRRHESFTLGSAFNSDFKNEMRESSGLKPYFVVDRSGSDETNFPSLQRQMSEKSDSKVSSVPETDTISSQAEQEDQKELVEEESNLEGEFASVDVKNIEQDNLSPTSEDMDSVDTDREKTEVHLNASGINNTELDNQSQSSEDVDSVDIEGEQAGALSDVSPISFKGLEEDYEVNHEMTSVFVDEKYSGGSSSSASSEANEKTKLDRLPDDPSKWSTESIQSTMTEMEVQAMGPVYDSSPSAVLSNMSALDEVLLYGKGVFDSTVVLDNSVASEGDLLSTSVQDKLSMSDIDTRNDAGSSMVGFSTVIASLPTVAEYDSRSSMATEINKQNIVATGVEHGLLAVADDSSKSIFAKSKPEDALPDPSLSSSNRNGNGDNSQVCLKGSVEETAIEMASSGTDGDHTEAQDHLNEKAGGLENEIFSNAAELKTALHEDKLFSVSVDLQNLTDANENPKEAGEATIGVKEIDEELLSELDAVGDFRVDNAVHATNLDVMADSLIDVSVQEALSKVRTVKVEDVHINSPIWEPVEGTSELEVIDARTLEDIHSAFKNIQEKIEEPVELIEPNSELEGIEAHETEKYVQLIERSSEVEMIEASESEKVVGSVEPNSKVEAMGTCEIEKSVETIEPCLELEDPGTHEIEKVLEPIKSSSEVEVIGACEIEKSVQPIVPNSEAEVIEAREIEKSVEPIVPHPEVEVIWAHEIEKSVEPIEPNSELDVIEAHSIEDLNLAIRCLGGETTDRSDASELGQGNLQLVQSVAERVEPDTVEEKEHVSVEAKSLEGIVRHEEGIKESSSLCLDKEYQHLVQPKANVAKSDAMEEHKKPFTDEMKTLEAFLHHREGHVEEFGAPKSHHAEQELSLSEVASIELDATERHAESVNSDVALKQLKEGDNDEFVFIESNNEKLEMAKPEARSVEFEEPETYSKPSIDEDRSYDFVILQSSNESSLPVKPAVPTLQPEETRGHLESAVDELRTSETIKQRNDGDIKESSILASGSEEPLIIQVEGQSGELLIERQEEVSLAHDASHSGNVSSVSKELAAQETVSSAEDQHNKKSTKVTKDKSNDSIPEKGHIIKSKSGTSRPSSSSSSSSSSSDSD